MGSVGSEDTNRTTDRDAQKSESLEMGVYDVQSRKVAEKESNIDDEFSDSDKKHIFKTTTHSSLYMRLSPDEVNRWRLTAIIISWINIFISILFGTLSYVFSVEDSSSAAFGFAVTALLNALTSSVVIWRYYGALSAYSERKEDRALVILGCLFVLLALCTGGSALYHIITHSTPDFSEEAANKLIIVSFLATFAMCITAVPELFAAKRLVSPTLLTDALNSLAGGIIALSIAISYSVGEGNPGSWYSDEITAIVIACFLFIYGVALLAKYVPVILRSSQYDEAS